LEVEADVGVVEVETGDLGDALEPVLERAAVKRSTVAMSSASASRRYTPRVSNSVTPSAWPLARPPRTISWWSSAADALVDLRSRGRDIRQP